MCTYILFSRTVKISILYPKVFILYQYIIIYIWHSSKIYYYKKKNQENFLVFFQISIEQLKEEKCDFYPLIYFYVENLNHYNNIENLNHQIIIVLFTRKGITYFLKIGVLKMLKTFKFVLDKNIAEFNYNLLYYYFYVRKSC